MSILEFFWPNHRHEQIREQQKGDDANDDCLHAVLLQFFAKPNVKSADDEECEDDSDED
jgi:hypothetical protein